MNNSAGKIYLDIGYDTQLVKPETKEIEMKSKLNGAEVIAYLSGICVQYCWITNVLKIK